MALQYTSVPERDFSFGIDVRSAENQIDPGFVRDLLNADIVERRVRKRRGYQGYGGNIPFRVIKLDQTNSTNEVCFTLDTSVSLEAVRSSPLVIYGRSSTIAGATGPFTLADDTVKYYSNFSIPLRKTLTAPSGTLTVAGTEHGLGTTNLFVSVLESTSLTDRSHQKLITDSISVNESSFDIGIGYTTYADRNVFVIASDKSTVNGSSYVYTATGVGTGSQTISIPAGTHNLSDFNILLQVQQDTGTSRIQVIPDTAVISSTGNITITLTNGTGASQDYYVILSATSTANQTAGSIAASATASITISNVTSPWLFYGIYLEQTPGGNRELVIPDAVDYDDVTQDVTFTFTNLSPSTRNFLIYYEYGTIRSNQLCVIDASVTADGTDSAPQLTIWGLDHTELYNTKEAREGWATHIDSYRRSGEQRLIAGLGGNLLSAQEYSEVATSHLLPILYPSLVVRTSGAQKLGPLFWATAEAPARTRGYITADGASSHFVTVTAVSFDSGNGWTKYTLSIPNKAILNSSGIPTAISSVISTSSNLEDWLTVNQMSYSLHEGAFRIRQVQDGTNQIFIWVENEDNSADFDDAGVAGDAAILTDQYVWSTTAPYIAGDRLLSQSLDETQKCNALSSSGTTTVSDGLVDLISIAAGVIFNGQRTSSVVPLRSGYPSAAQSVTNLVRGDMLSYGELARELRVKHINPDSDRAISITVTEGIATAVLGSGTTDYLTAGMDVLLTQAGVYSGAQTIGSVTSSTSFTFATSETTAEPSAYLIGKTIQVDEDLDWTDTIGDTTPFRVERRWIPLEAPDDSFNLTPTTHVRYFDSSAYSDQPFLRSTMVVDNMYFTNGQDEVYKLDGSNVYRAGLPAWQPGLFLTQETSGATIVTDLRTVAYSARTAVLGRLTITAATSGILPVGSTVRLSGSTESYTILDYTDDGSNFYVLMNRALDSSVSATGNVSEIGVFRYYYRLNAVDVNSNIIASAVTGYQDHVVELTQNAAVLHRIVGFPAWDSYDFDRLEVQIYRTKMNQAAPFYLITTIAMDFDNTLGYISYRDSFSDSNLSSLDIVNTALKGQEIGTNWSDPLRAKYVTSLGNSLVLGHISDYPQLDIQVVADADTVDADFAGDTLLFRKDNEDTSSTTDMVNRVKYEWINGFSGTVSAFTPGSGNFTFTTSAPTGAVVGDWIYLTYSSVATTARILDYSGWWQISAISGSDITVKLVGAAAAASYPNKYVIATDPTDVPVLLGTDGNLGMVNGDSFDIFDSMRRMSMAINATMRMVDVTISGMSTFVPWLTCRGGNDASQAGRLIVRQPRADIATIELVPTFSGYQLFVNSIQRSSTEQISASTRVYPSRLLVSYENYPEIMDTPTSILDVDSDSAIDVNSADGQEMTGVIPFFGQAAFTAAQQASILVVFKTNSIYLVDINQKRLGNQAVQRIETEGLGCTAPYSIAATKGGIMFANESGMYCLRRDLTIEYIGRYMERNWGERVSLQNLALAQGHHYGVGRSYKLSIPLAADITDTGYIENSEVYVYNHTTEAPQKQGAWGRFDNHPATGWANLADNAFFGSSTGRVFILRNTGLIEDFRDDSSPIDFEVQTRPIDFGNGGIRKVVGGFVIHYRVGATSSGTTVSYSPDLNEEFQETTDPIITKPIVVDNLSDIIRRDITTIRHDLGRRRCVYMAILVANDAIDESVEIAGIDFLVAGLSDKGILQASQTRT